MFALCLALCVVPGARADADLACELPTFEGDRSAVVGTTFEGRIEAPFVAVRQVLRRVESFGAWFPTLTAWRVLERVPEQVAERAAERVRVYGRHGAPWPFRERDYVVDYRGADLGAGRFRLDAKGAAAPDARAPVVADVVRIDVLCSRWRLTDDGGSTRVGYGARFLPRGSLPRWVEARAARVDGRRLFEALEAEVARQAGERGP